jgi:membrane protease YdiL (CAAX protease family)
MTRTESVPGPAHARQQPALRARHVVGFLALSHGWTWAFWGAAALRGGSVWEMPTTILLYVGGVGVLLAGIAMTHAVRGADGLRDLGRRTADPRRIGARWWAVILLLYPALTFAAAGIAMAAGVTGRPLDLAGAAARIADPAALLSTAAFILILGPLPEEIGWRGYLQDRLMARWSALAASLLVGLAWWSWHLPLFVLPGYFDAFGRAAPTPLDFLYNIMPAAVLYAWVYLNTDRSVLAAILFHFMENFSSEMLGIAEAVRPVRLALIVALLILIVWRRGPAPPRGGTDRPAPRTEPM